MLGKKLEKADLNLAGRFAGTSWGQKLNFAANAGLQFVAHGLQVPQKAAEHLADVLTPGGADYWRDDQRMAPAGPYRENQRKALDAASNPNLSLLDRGLNASAAVLSTPAVVVEEMIVAPVMKVPQQASDVGVHIAQAENTTDPVQKAVHRLEALKSASDAAATMLGVVVGARGVLEAASDAAAARSVPPKPGDADFIGPLQPPGAGVAPGSAAARGRLDLAGKEHPVSGVRFNEGGFPEFESLHDVTIPQQLRGPKVSDAAQFRAATRELRETLRANPELRQNFTAEQLKAIDGGQARIPGLTWHHAEDGLTLQLVDRTAHSATGHAGGRQATGGRP